MTDTERKELETELYELKRTASLFDKAALERIREIKEQLGIIDKPREKKGWLHSDCRKYAKYLV